MRSDIFTLNTDMNSYKDLILSEDGILFWQLFICNKTYLWKAMKNNQTLTKYINSV